MLILLSPSKSLDFESPPAANEFSLPDFLDQSQLLIDKLRCFSPQEIASLMGVSDSLARLNVARYAEWSLPFLEGKARQAVLAFNGDVYDGLDAKSLSASDLGFANAHLRILSGLYGVLRPLDLVMPYRLEMGIRLGNPRGKDLYAFWGERLTDALNSAVGATASTAVVNLASVEYFKAVKTKRLTVPAIHPVFEDWSGGKYKVVSFYAKRARGLMARFAITRRIVDPLGLQSFAEDGYAYDPAASDSGGGRWVFRRKLK